MVKNLDLIISSIIAKIKEWQARPQVEAFHKLWYDEAAQATWGSTRWLGVMLQKCPLDLFVQQDIITDLRPTLIIETGTWCSGSALFYATLLQLLGIKGEVVTIDIAPTYKANHPFITYIEGSSTSDEVMIQVHEKVEKNKGPVLVVLDSDHSPTHVAKELELYSPLVTIGSYLIVEDTNISGKPVTNELYPLGPYPAVEEFLRANRNFVQDFLCEHYLLTMHPGGWLKKIG